MVIDKIKAVVNGLNTVCKFILGVDMLALFAVLLLQIISRFVAFMPMPWSQDMITFLLVVSVFLGAGAATAKGKQIRLEFFVDLLPKKVTKIILCLADCLSVYFLGVICGQCFKLGGENISLFIGGSLVPMGVYYFVVAFGCIVMICNFVVLILERLMEVFGKEKKEEDVKA